MGLVGGLVGGVGDLVGGLLGGGKQTSSTPPPASSTPAAPAPTSTQPSNPTKPTSQPAPNQPTNPTSSSPSTPQESTPAGSSPDAPVNSSPGSGNNGSTDNDNDAPAAGTKPTNTNAFTGSPTGVKPVVNVASPDPNIPLGNSNPNEGGKEGSSAPVSGGVMTPGVGNVEWGTTTAEGSSLPSAGSLNDKSSASKSGGLPLGAAAAIGVFGVLFALLIGLLCYRRVILAKRRSRREEARAAGARNTVDWDFRDTRTSMFSIGSSVESESTAVMQGVPGGISVSTTNHVATDASRALGQTAPFTPVSPAILSPNTPASAGVHQPLIDIEAQAASHVASPYQDYPAQVARSQSTRSLTAPYPAIVVAAPNGNSPRVSNVSSVSTVNPFTLSRPENPVPPLSPLYGSFDEDPFASPYDGAVPTSSKTSLALHPENPFHPERA